MERLRLLWHKILLDIHKAPIWVWIGGALSLVLIYFAWRNAQGGGTMALTPLTPLDSSGGGSGSSDSGGAGGTLPLPPVLSILDAGSSGSSGGSSSTSGGGSSSTSGGGSSSTSGGGLGGFWGAVTSQIQGALTDVSTAARAQDQANRAADQRTIAQITAARQRRTPNPAHALNDGAVPRTVAARGMQPPPAHLAADVAQQPHPVVSFARVDRHQPR